MNTKTVRTLAITSAIVAGVAALGTTALYAAAPTDTTTRLNPLTTLVTAISQKFNLNQTDVQKVFDEQRSQMHQQMQAQRGEAFKIRLAKAVTDGKLTQAQADLITIKHTEFQTFTETLQGKTETERQAALTTKQDELKEWAKTNNIPEQFALFGPIGGPGRGKGEANGRGPGHMNKMGEGMRGLRRANMGAPVVTPTQTN